MQDKASGRGGTVGRPSPVRVGRETKGRGGKGVTVVTGLPLRADQLAALAARLKRRCGTGGTVKDGVIELQGDQRDIVVVELVRLGFAAKRSGG
jgi:translation initiation factor 1